MATGKRSGCALPGGRVPLRNEMQKFFSIMREEITGLPRPALKFKLRKYLEKFFRVRPYFSPLQALSVATSQQSARLPVPLASTINMFPRLFGCLACSAALSHCGHELCCLAALISTLSLNCIKPSLYDKAMCSRITGKPAPIAWIGTGFG